MACIGGWESHFTSDTVRRALNGRELGTHRGGYDDFSFDIIDSLWIVPDTDADCFRLTAAGTGTVEAVAGTELTLAIPNPKLWSPESPHLYDLQVTLKSGGKGVDSVASCFGMCKIALGKDEQGVTRLMLNGRFVFQVGPLPSQSPARLRRGPGATSGRQWRIWRCGWGDGAGNTPTPMSGKQMQVAFRRNCCA